MGGKGWSGRNGSAKETAWRDECEIEGDGAVLVRAAETKKVPAGREKRKTRGGQAGDGVGKIGKREIRVKTTQNTIDRDGESVVATKRERKRMREEDRRRWNRRNCVEKRTRGWIVEHPPQVRVMVRLRYRNPQYTSIHVISVAEPVWRQAPRRYDVTDPRFADEHTSPTGWELMNEILFTIKYPDRVLARGRVYEHRFARARTNGTVGPWWTLGTNWIRADSSAFERNVCPC